MEELNIKCLFFYYCERVRIIVISTLLFLVVGVVYSLINRPKYISESSITVTGDMGAAKNQSTLYAPQVVNNEVLQKVISTLGLKTSVKNLKDNITATSETTSDTIYITVENTNSKKAMEINAELDRVFIDYVIDHYNNKNIKIASEATITGGGIVKKYAKQIVVITLVGFSLGIIYIFIRFYFDDTLKAEDDIKGLKLDIYGVIPKDSSKDSYLNIINSITTKSIDIKNKVILMTSIDDTSNSPKEIYELANQYAELDKKVLIIDTDLKNNKIAELYDVKSKEGYVDYINSKSDKVDSYITKTKNKLVSIISNGSNTINQVEVLSSNKNEKLIEEVKDKYDVVIINTPPILGENGTILLSKYSNINLLLVTNSKTRIGDIKKANDIFSNNELLLKGIIVNNVNNKFNNYSSYYLNNYYNK